MKKIINKIKGKVDSAELFNLKSKTIPINFEVGHLKSIDISDYEGHALRVIKNKLIGFSAESGGKDSDSFIKKAIATSEFGMEANFEFPVEINRGNENLVKIYDPKVKEKNISEMIVIGKEIIAQIKDVNKDLRCDLTLLKHDNEIEYINSWGVEFNYKKSFLSYSMMIQKVEEQDILMMYSSIDSGKDDLNSKDLTDSLLKKLKWGKNIVDITGKNMPVILTPNAALVLLLPIISGLNGKNVLKKISRYFL